MLSENPDLTVDDLQGIISASCTDIKSDYHESGVDLSGWDKYTGWGRINSDSCLVFADPLHPACYQVEHYLVEGGGAVFDSTTTKELVEFGDGAELQYEHDLEGSYLVRRFEVRRSVTPPSNYRFLWPVYRNTAGYEWSGTKGGFSDTYNTQVRYIGLVPSTQHEATCDLFSYTYKVWDGTTYIGWYPAPPESLDWAYGALIQGGASGVGEHTIETGGVLRIVTALPNPTAEQITVFFAVPKPGRVAVDIYDVAGRRVRALDSRRLRAGTHRLTWNGLNDAGEEVSPGMYFCRVSTVEQADVKKIVLVRGVD